MIYFLMSMTHMPHLFSCPYFLNLFFFFIISTVDSLLDPDNRLHLTTDEQLKVLLDKLDMVTSMRSSGGRTKRIRLLRREINTLRQKMNQQKQNQSVNGKDKDDEGKEEEEEEEQEERKKKKQKTNVVDNGLLTTVSNSGTGKKILLL